MMCKLILGIQVAAIIEICILTLIIIYKEIGELSALLILGSILIFTWAVIRFVIIDTPETGRSIKAS